MRRGLKSHMCLHVGTKGESGWERKKVWGLVLGHANMRGQGVEEGPVKRTKEQQPVSGTRRTQGAGIREPRGEGISARRACQLCQVMLSGVNWGLNTDHQDWQLSASQTKMGEA